MTFLALQACNEDDMRAFKPTTITDTNYTNNLTEPDGALNEVEWKDRNTDLTRIQYATDLDSATRAGDSWWFAVKTSGKVIKTDDDFTYQTEFTPETLFKPRGVTYDGAGFLYVLAHYSGTYKVYKFDETLPTTVLDSWTITGDEPLSLTYAEGYLSILFDTTTSYVIRDYSLTGSLVSASDIVLDSYSFAVSDLDYKDSHYYIAQKTVLSAIKINRDTGDTVGSITYRKNISGSTAAIGINGDKMIVVSWSGITGTYETNTVYEFIPEPFTYAAWGAGEQAVISSNHKKYEAITTNTDSPDDGVTNKTWVELGNTNKYAMFDANIGNKSISAKGTVSTAPVITQTYDTGSEYITAVSVFGLVGGISATVEVDDGIVLYSNTFDITGLDRFTLIDLPQAYNADVTVTITGAVGVDNIVQVGELVLGESYYIGVTQFGSGYELRDYSRVDRDDFGNVTIIQRGTADIMTFNVKIDKSDFASVRQTLESFRSTPAVWVGDDTDSAYTVYGIYEGLNINWSTPSLYDCSFKINGLT